MGRGRASRGGGGMCASTMRAMLSSSAHAPSPWAVGLGAAAAGGAAPLVPAAGAAPLAGEAVAAGTCWGVRLSGIRAWISTSASGSDQVARAVGCDADSVSRRAPAGAPMTYAASTRNAPRREASSRTEPSPASVWRVGLPSGLTARFPAPAGALPARRTAENRAHSGAAWRQWAAAQSTPRVSKAERKSDVCTQPASSTAVAEGGVPRTVFASAA
mmetsp:Transcript_7065/g.23191  ORF Transcript_7065/g.23191 Transcript_7065/m.23191 type:complete len:216 (-) Transcript_7065:1351-1998(-)|eukprot:scaffold4626_cov108-Isochrysis_galbana.AAC.2